MRIDQKFASLQIHVFTQLSNHRMLHVQVYLYYDKTQRQIPNEQALPLKNIIL